MPKAATRKAKPAAKAAPKPAPASRTSRLGDEVAAPLSREPVTLIVAKTDVVAGKVRMRKMATSPLRVAKGQVVHVKHTYRLQEHSEEREEYRFLLKSSLDGVAKPPSLARLGDQWGVPEDISGYVQHDYTLSKPGKHTLTFEAGSEYCVMGWGDTEVKALERAELKGTVEIIVG